jgi:hypothetical protein
VRVIELTKGQVAIVDDLDFDQLAQYRWCVTLNNGKFYAMRRVGKAAIYMHVAILQVEPGFEIDHKNGNSLDNRRCNLRPATRVQNSCNKKVSATSQLQIKGVGYDARYKLPFYSRIQLENDRVFLGRFTTLEEAKDSYKRLFNIMGSSQNSTETYFL